VNGPRVEVTGNFVGTDVLGRDLGGVESGVWVQTLDAVIGSDVAEPDGTVPGRGNVIAFNGAKGIRVSSGSSSSLRGNVIRDNGGIGIDLANDGATPNDPGDGDDGANHLQNFPVLDAGATSYNPALDQLSTSYFVDSTPGANATYPLAIDFYLDDGGGQAAMWLGSDVYAAIDAGSPVAATFTVPSGVIVGGSQILATATDSSAGVGSTSELGAPVAVPEPGVVLGIGAGAALLALLRRNRFA
jgi:parallel beta-helix repeat protein